MTTLPFYLLLIISLLLSLSHGSGEKATEEESASVESDDQPGKQSLVVVAEGSLTSTKAPKDQLDEKSATDKEISPATGEGLASEQKLTKDEEAGLHTTSTLLSAERAYDEEAQDEGRSAAPSEASLSEQAEVKEEQTSSTRAPLQGQTTEEEDNSSSREGSLDDSSSLGVLSSLDEDKNLSADDANDASEKLLDGEVDDGSRAGRVGGAKPVARRSQPNTRRPAASKPTKNQINRQPRPAANKAKGGQLKTPPLRRPQGQSVKKTSAGKRAFNANGNSSTARRQGQFGKSSTFGKNPKSNTGVRKPSSTAKRPPHGAGGGTSKVNSQTRKKPPQNKPPSRASGNNRPPGSQIRATERKQAIKNSNGKTKTTASNKTKKLNPVNAQNQPTLKKRHPTAAPRLDRHKKPPLANKAAGGNEQLKTKATASPKKISPPKSPGRVDVSKNNRQQKTQALKVNPASTQTSSDQSKANGSARRQKPQVNPPNNNKLPPHTRKQQPKQVPDQAVTPHPSAQKVAVKPNLDTNGGPKQVPSAQVTAPKATLLKPSSAGDKQTAPTSASATSNLKQVPPVTDRSRPQDKPSARPSGDAKPVVAKLEKEPTKLKGSSSSNKQLPGNIDELPGTDKRTGRGTRDLSGESLGTLPGTDERTARRPRALGGEPISTLPPYLATVYSQTVSPDEGLKMQGQAILVGPDHALIHQDSFDTIEKWDKELPKNGDQELGAKVVSLGVDALGGNVAHGSSVFLDGLKDAGILAVDTVLGDKPKPAGLKIERNSTIDPVDGGPTYNDKLHHFEIVGKNLDDTGFHLVRLTDLNKGQDSEHEAWRRLEPPKFETDRSNFGSGCHLYGFSSDTNRNWRTGLDSGDSRKSLSPSRKQQMVRIPIIDPVAGNCAGSVCVLKTQQEGASGSCSPTDHTSPIVCGPERKLTYISKGRNCNSGLVKAVHVGHFAGQIENTHSSWMATREPYVEPSKILDRLIGQ